MRIAIVSDIHANLAALEAVLRHAEEQRALESLWCLGDSVGYGPEPGACLRLLKRYNAVNIAGNHDLASIGHLDIKDFNPDAATAAIWTMGQLDDEERSYIDGLSQIAKNGDFTLVHGTLRWPVWEYLYSVDAALGHLARQETRFGVVGHTHVPMLVREEAGGQCRLEYLEDETVVALGDERLVINPGGVGQPRDGDPRASYAIYDVDAATITVHRVEYDIAATQTKMKAAGLPSRLIERLSYGR